MIGTKRKHLRYYSDESTTKKLERKKTKKSGKLQKHLFPNENKKLGKLQE